MKKLQFQSLISSIVLLLIFLFQSPFGLMAQTDYHTLDNNVLFGTSNSRLTATIKQTGNHVTMTVGAVGLMVADGFNFSVLFHPDSLQIADTLFNPVLATGMAGGNPDIYKTIRIEPLLKSRNFEVGQETNIRIDNSTAIGGTGYPPMYAFDVAVLNPNAAGLDVNERIDLPAGEFVPLFTIHFIKSSSAPLNSDAFGFYNRTAVGVAATSYWVYDGTAITYYPENFMTNQIGNRNLFSYRTPSSVQTNLPTDIVANSAILNGIYKKGELPPVYNLIDSMAPTTPGKKGRLLTDTIVRYGFFYAETNITSITHTEYSNLIAVNGTSYPFPTDAMIAQGYFMAGTDTIKIMVTGVSSSSLSANYSDTVKGLKANTSYNVWAFAQYVFETSNKYPLVGVRQTITTTQTMNITSVFAATHPSCGSSNGSIQVNVIGGSGSYHYSFDGVHYSNYPTSPLGLITGLGAGSYRIYIRDAYDTTASAAVSAEIILHNNASDLFVNMAAIDASNCVLANGALHVSTGGGVAPYTYTLNNQHDTVINGKIENLAAGIYVLKVTDALGCVATTGEVHLLSATSMLDWTLDAVTATDCNETLGEITFTVTGASSYQYQLDGMAVVTANHNNPILIDGLKAGTHTLRVWDACGVEKSQEVIVPNNGGSSAFAVTATTTDVKVACNGTVTQGRIVITATNGHPTFQYTLDGATWAYFPAGVNTVTVNKSEGTYYLQVLDTAGTGCAYEINGLVIGRETAEPINVLAGFSSTDPTCGQNDGTIQIHATGGSGSYLYSLDGTTYNSYPNGLITGLAANSYHIYVKDASDMTCAPGLSDEIFLRNSDTDLEISILAENASTCSASDGALYVSVSGGNGTYTYTYAAPAGLAGTTPTITNGKITNLPVGAYILNVSSGGCTATSGTEHITSSASTLALTLTDSTQTICGASVGTATFRITGSSNYSYQLDGFAVVSGVTHNNPITLTNLGAGEHTLRVFDNCAEIERTIVIGNGENGGFEFAVTVTNEILACDGSTTGGTLKVKVANGTPSYTYIMDGLTGIFAGDSIVFSGLSEGTHYVRVEDTTGCSYAMSSINIGREKMPVLNINASFMASNPSNCGATDGEIQMYVTGGSGEYQYSTDNVTYQDYAGGLITGLGAGSYRIYVKDKNYSTCTPAQSDEIILENSNSDLQIDVVSYPATSCNTSDGELHVSTVGGNGTYTYTYAAPAGLAGTHPTVTNGKITGLPVGIYVLNVESDGCLTTSGEKRISSDASILAVNLTVTSNTVCGDNIGAVKFTVTPNAGTYSYQIDGKPVVNVSHTNPITVSGLSAGVHKLRVFDYCDEIIEEFTITNGQDGLAFTVDVENVKVACDGSKINGSLHITATNGVHNLTCYLDGTEYHFAAGKDTLTLSVGLGTHYVVVEDATGCTFEWNSIVVGQEPLPALNITSSFAAQSPTCGNADGQIQLNVEGGSGLYQYRINGTGAYQPYTNGLITGLSSGNYRIEVRDSLYKTCNTAWSDEVMLRDNASDLTVSMVAANASNCTTPNGKLYVSVSGGTGVYTYVLNNVAGAPTAGVYTKPAGTYILKVTDANGCSATSDEVRIESDNSDLDLDIDEVIHTICGVTIGTVKFTVTSSEPYKYQMDGMGVVSKSGTATVTINALSAGEHHLRVWDNCGMEKTETIIIRNDQPNGLAFTVTPENETLSCDGATVIPGSIHLNVTSGTPNYTYVIEKIGGTVSGNFAAGKDTVTITGLSEGTYLVKVEDAANCTYIVTSIQITRESMSLLSMDASIVATNPTSCTSNNGTIQLVVTGGSGEYQYSKDGGLTYGDYANGLITGLGAGSYRIYVQDKNFPCTPAISDEVILVNPNSDLTIEVTSEPATTCDIPDGVLNVAAFGGNGVYVYTYAAPAALAGTTASVVNGKIENLPVGVYVINVTSNGCLTTSGEVRISSDASILDADITVTSQTVCGEKIGAVRIDVTPNDPVQGYTYQLDGYPSVTVTHTNPITISGLSAGVHKLRIEDYCDEIIKEFTITNGTDGLAFTVDVENVKIACNGDMINGSLHITATNGVHNLTCYLDGTEYHFAAGKDTLTLPVGLGTHKVVVEDATGCTFEWNSIFVGKEPLPLVDVATIYVVKNPTCGMSNGQIQVYATGGSGQYLYSKDNGGSYQNYPNGLITGLAAGSYRIYVRDAVYSTCASAVSTDVILDSDNGTFSMIVSTDSASSCSANDGILYISALGGSGTYKYSVNGATTTLPATGQLTRPAGVYVVTVTDLISDCVISSGEVRIHARTSDLALNLIEVTNTVCGSTTGAVKFQVTGTTATAYSYQLDNTPIVAMTNNNVIVLSGLSAGTHTLRAFNACGEETKAFTVTNGASSLAFTAEINNNGCGVDPADRSIILTVTDGTAPYRYSTTGGSTWSAPINSTTITIANLETGTYTVMLKDAANCEYQQNQIRMDEKGTILPPSVTTPQTFCAGATVADLQATGVGIKWYATPTGGWPLASTHSLDSGAVYYAAQTIDVCESEVRSAVTVLVKSRIILDAPSIASPQSFCTPVTPSLTLANIAINGNATVVWYNQAVNGTVLPLSTPLTDSTIYYAAQVAGGCQSAVRAEVLVTFGGTHSDSAKVESPQTFCRGALIANIAVPHNQILWYTAATGGTLLTPATILVDGATYYATYKAGNCESEHRTPVTVYLSSPDAPVVPPVQTVCGGKTTLADLTVTGSGIVWYADATSTVQLPTSTVLVVGEDYYAAQSSVSCEGARARIEITDRCFTLKGTVFPFVHTGTASFDDNFPVFVKLYQYPTTVDCDNPVEFLANSSVLPLHTESAVWHNGSEFIPNTPKRPGTVGKYNNPGLPINWSAITTAPGTPDGQLLVNGTDMIPVTVDAGNQIGKYSLENVTPGDYLLVISRQGFVTRIGKITVSDDAYLGHRELISGDVDGNFRVNTTDVSAEKQKFYTLGHPQYSPKYDLNGDAVININDFNCVKGNSGANFHIYEETKDWLLEKGCQ